MGCNRMQPRVRRNGLELSVEWNKKDMDEENQEQESTLTAEKVHEIFKLISDEDCTALGLDPRFSRPDWMVITCLPVAPLSVRPSVVLHGGSARSQVLSHSILLRRAVLRNYLRAYPLIG